MVLLRESSRVLGQDVDVEAVVDSRRAPVGGDYGFPGARELLAFATAANRAANPAMTVDDGSESADLAAARRELVAVVGSEGLLEAVATVAAFNGLVRVADGTGIALDDAMIVASADVRDQLELDDMAGAANTSHLGSGPAAVGLPAVDVQDRTEPVRSLFADADAAHVAEAAHHPHS